MKLSAVIATLALGSWAYACPNLSGTYVCQGEQGPQTVVVSQTEAGGVTTYKFDNDDLVADGQPHEIVEQEMKGSYVATCTAEVLGVVLKADLLNGGNVVGKIDASQTMQVDASGNLANDLKGTLNYNGQNVDISNAWTCNKQAN